MLTPERRTQAERRTTTRAALLRATIACLVEQGYTRTTTTEVTRRAGVSQGALFKHFPTKSALVAAATERLFEDTIEEFSLAFERSTDAEAPMVIALRRLWEVFCTPELLAVYRLYVEAPVDAELMAALVPVVKKHAENLTARALALFPELGASPATSAFFASVIFAMQGLSLQRPVYVDAAQEALILTQFEVLARTCVPAAQSGGKARA
jgi:AcrR family transcriptional regulator